MITEKYVAFNRVSEVINRGQFHVKCLSVCKKYGYIPFEQMSFKAGDNVALCAVFYMPFEEVVSADFSADPMSFADASRLLFGKRDFEHKPLGLFISKENSILMMEMSKKKRYAEMQVAACRSCLDASPAIQFAAMTFLLPDQTIVIVFRGTDDTKEGWAEDLEMVNSVDGIPSAKESLLYLQEAAERFEGDIILCGHSPKADIMPFLPHYMPMSRSKKESSLFITTTDPVFQTTGILPAMLTKGSKRNTITLFRNPLFSA